MIEAKNLRKVYKTKKGVVVNALDDVSVKLPDTGMVFILGKSGSGKSTLLNVLGGLDSIDSGEIIIKGSSARDFKQSHYDSYRNTYIGFIFQEYNVLEDLTVGANVALAIELQGRKATNEEINEILCEVDLDGYGARKPNELSGGQKQRVAIARALVKKPEIIMADEPTGALDSATGKQVFDTLKKLSRDKLVLIVSHDREFSEQYADRIIELKDGVIISDVEKTESSAEAFVLEEENVIYSENEITVAPGYALTEEDRLAINEYLSAKSTGTAIKLSEKKKKNAVSSSDFRPTDESKIKSNKQGDFKLIRSKLSMKNAFKLGSGGLKHKKFRLVFTIFLSLIAFTLFGLADTIAAYDSITTATNSIYDTGVDYASFIKNVKDVWGEDEDDFYWNDYNTVLSEENLKKIEEETGVSVVGIYNKELSASFKDNVGQKRNDGVDLTKLFTSSFSGVSKLDAELAAKLGINLVAGTYPANGKNEIVLTKFMYDYLEKAGYIQFDDKGTPTEHELTKPEDLVGKTLGISFERWGGMAQHYTVVGIVDTHFDYSRYEPLMDNDAQYNLSTLEMMSLTEELEAARNYSLACVAFTSEETFKKIVGADEGAATRYEGSFELLMVADDSAEDYWEMIESNDNNNVKERFWFDSISNLDTFGNKVVWLSDTHEPTLKDNQIFVPINVLLSTVNFSGGKDDADLSFLYDSSYLKGKELVFIEKNEEWSLYNVTVLSILENTDFYASLIYATENEDDAIAKFKAYCMTEHSMSEDIFNTMYPDKESQLRACVESLRSENKLKLADSTYVKNYRNDVIERYGLSDHILPEEITNLFSYEVTLDGVEFKDEGRLLLKRDFMNNASWYLTKKYAIENYEDAKALFKYAKNITSQADLEKYSPSSYIELYETYINNSSIPEAAGYVSIAKESFRTYYAKTMLEAYKLLGGSTSESKLVLYANPNYRNENLYKNVEIVGIVADTNAYSNVAVISDALFDKMVGANKGGIYSFAVGAMPEDQSGVNKVVSFTKTFEESNYRFQLKNNVTQQLDMVDELLDTLGQVFLYVGIGFALFASLMLSNFISTSISYKKQEIGILRAIGSRSADVFRIFFAESFIIAMINFVLSLAGTLTATLLINSALRNDAGLLITFLNFGVRQVAILLGISILIAFIATFLPVKKIASMKPIDAIKNRR